MPTRGAPLAFALRQDLPWLLEPAPCAHEDADGLSAPAREVLGVLARAGASFLTDLVHQTGRLAMEVEEALWELVACGLVTGDGMAGLRTLLLPDIKRLPPRHRAGGWRGVGIRARLMPVGRWALLRLGEAPGEGHGKQEGRDEAMARQLLRRYGVVVRELLARENAAPPWRILLHLYRRMEARGEIRGGRFVGGLVGEQFALPEAVEALRGVRRQRAGDERVTVSAADPLNLVGILTPGPRISPFAQQVIVYQAGVPIEVGALGAVRSRLQSQVAMTLEEGQQTENSPAYDR
jgi:ATP-dependent Lhr-like helicase